MRFTSIWINLAAHKNPHLIWPFIKRCFALNLYIYVTKDKNPRSFVCRIFWGERSSSSHVVVDSETPSFAATLASYAKDTFISANKKWKIGNLYRKFFRFHLLHFTPDSSYEAVEVPKCDVVGGSGEHSKKNPSKEDKNHFTCNVRVVKFSGE